jgi:hypothetical protein
MSSAPVPARKPARVALIGLDDPSAAVLADCFRQFGIDTFGVSVAQAERIYTEKFDATALYLDESAERLLEMARALPANFRMVIYGLAKTPAQALRYSRYGINAIIRDPIEREDVLRALRATHLLVVHEFRRYIRVPLITTVELHAEGRTLMAMGEEISSGGMSLLLSGKLPPGLSVEVVFTLPNAAPMRIPSSIRWSREGQLGVRFNPSDPNRRRLKEWLDHYLGVV